MITGRGEKMPGQRGLEMQATAETLMYTWAILRI